MLTLCCPGLPLNLLLFPSLLNWLNFRHVFTCLPVADLPYLGLASTLPLCCWPGKFLTTVYLYWFPNMTLACLLTRTLFVTLPVFLLLVSIIRLFSDYICSLLIQSVPCFLQWVLLQPCTSGTSINHSCLLSSRSLHSQTISRAWYKKRAPMSLCALLILCLLYQRCWSRDVMETPSSVWPWTRCMIYIRNSWWLYEAAGEQSKGRHVTNYYTQRCSNILNNQ